VSSVRRALMLSGSRKVSSTLVAARGLTVTGMASVAPLPETRIVVVPPLMPVTRPVGVTLAIVRSSDL
jgi:hypothetical protein